MHRSNLASALNSLPPRTRLAEEEGCRHCAPVRAERDELAERVRQLEGILSDQSWVPSEWGLTATEATVLNVLAQRQLATKEAILTALYGADPDGGASEKMVDVMIHHLRKKLKPFGLVIETVWGHGVRLSAAAREAVRTLRKAAL